MYVTNRMDIINIYIEKKKISCLILCSPNINIWLGHYTNTKKLPKAALLQPNSTINH